MGLSHYFKIMDLAIWGGDLISSHRVEILLPEEEKVRSLEYWAFQTEEDPELWDVLRLQGQYDPWQDPPHHGGVSLFQSDFMAEEQSFRNVVDIFENIAFHVRHPHNGLLIRPPERLRVGDCERYNHDEVGFRLRTGNQRHFTRQPEYAEIYQQRQRLRDSGLG